MSSQDGKQCEKCKCIEISAKCLEQRVAWKGNELPQILLNFKVRFDMHFNYSLPGQSEWGASSVINLIFPIPIWIWIPELVECKHHCPHMTLRASLAQSEGRVRFVWFRGNISVPCLLFGCWLWTTLGWSPKIPPSIKCEVWCFWPTSVW